MFKKTTMAVMASALMLGTALAPAARAATDQQELVDRASITVSDLKKDQEFGNARDLIRSAKAVMISAAADGPVLLQNRREGGPGRLRGASAGRGLRRRGLSLGGGHLNDASGFGDWPAVLDWCRRDNLAFY